MVQLRLLTRRIRSYKQRQTQVKNEIHNLDVSSSTVYRHIRKGYLSIAPIDLVRAVKFKEKGTSFDNLTQEDINLVCSHVNSVKHAVLNGKSTYELFAFTYGEEIPKLLGISKIPAEDVCQSSKLLQHKI